MGGRPLPLVLVGMSAREVAARDTLGALAAPHDGQLAFLQVGPPSVARTLDRLCDGGARHVTLVGVSLGRLAPGVSWLRRVVAHWWRERPEPRPVLEIGTSLVADAAELREVLDGRLRPVTGAEAGLTSAAWEDVPGHRHQVLVCRGPRCSARGGDEALEALVVQLMCRGQGDDDVLVAHTGCLYPCNHAPVVCVQPDDVWYGAVDADVAARIVDEHLVGGRPLTDHRLPRTRAKDL
jgi:(2Fe-2S) ferredoxin